VESRQSGEVKVLAGLSEGSSKVVSIHLLRNPGNAPPAPTVRAVVKFSKCGFL